MVQDQGGPEFQPAGILKYVEDLQRGPNAEVGPIDIFEIASIISNGADVIPEGTRGQGFKRSSEMLKNHKSYGSV